jgi:hypothetical protein
MNPNLSFDLSLVRIQKSTEVCPMQGSMLVATINDKPLGEGEYKELFALREAVTPTEFNKIITGGQWDKQIADLGVTEEVVLLFEGTITEEPLHRRRAPEIVRKAYAMRRRFFPDEFFWFVLRGRIPLVPDPIPSNK